ncbi:hypothetical protein B1R94_22405 [Mycolicibacterium litorale]|nr:hypothetical protein B1R94_22405 [Mycolicibacterium litorale]
MTTSTAPSAAPAAGRIDALRPAAGYRYEDRDIVVLRRRPAGPAGPERCIGRTPHFTLGRDDGRLVVVHDLAAADVHNGIGDLLVDELFTPGWAVGADTFERLFTGLVLTSHHDPLAAWELFYRNSLHRLDQDASPDAGESAGVGVFSQIYRRAEQLISAIAAGSVLDVGTCFGFLPLRLRSGSAGPVQTVIASDVQAGTTHLLDQVSRRLARQVRTLTCDAARIPLGDECVDVVTVLHLLEHVDAAHGGRIIDEALRIARRRVVIAVPLEDGPESTYGHVRQITTGDLRAMAVGRPGWIGAVSEFHGGWLVLDRIAPVNRC